jgi:hypothetical protein
MSSPNESVYDGKTNAEFAGKLAPKPNAQSMA